MPEGMFLECTLPEPVFSDVAYVNTLPVAQV